MTPGDGLLGLALVTGLLAGVMYFPSLRGRATPRASNRMFIVHTLALVAAVALLWFYFAAHRFEVVYVAQYSSRALSPALTFAASWAGQEGSILLWATLAALCGLALMREPGTLTRPAMTVVSATQVFLTFLLISHSPFRVHLPAPADGEGLNPLLQDPWMVIHPPVLFAGYAALIAPFALAVASLARGAYKEWNRAVWPWALLAVALLGTGIALGGVWAYKVLGWGGYWGWDPVENASLVPWLIAVALLHGLLIQRTRGALVRTNLTLAMLAWLAVLAGTWLTRSGALEKFSVHSFPSSGIGPPLLAFLLASLLLGAGLLVTRWSTLAAGESSWSTLSRESALWAGLMTVMVFAGLVAFGTAAPVLTSLAGAPASLHSSFYERISIPLGMATVLLMAIAPALRWSKQAGWSWLTALLPGLVAGLGTLVVLLLLGRVREPEHVVLLVLSGAALGINAWMTVRLFRRGWSYGAGYLGHVGIAIMVLGMILSTTLGKTERLRLAAGVPRDAMGYRLTYLGESVDARGKHLLRVRVRDGAREFEVGPELFKMPRGEGMMRKPYISRRPDLYLSPVEVESAAASADSVVWLARGQSVAVGNAEYRFESFRLEPKQGFRVYANVQVRQGGQVTQATPGMVMEGASRRPIEVRVAGVGPLSVAAIDADHGRVGLRVPGSGAGAAVLELSTKPLVDLVWIGALLALLGAAIAGIRRAMDVTAGRQVAARPVRAAAS